MEAVPPEHCPGVGSEEAGKANSCAGCPNQKICSSGEVKQAAEAEMETIIPLIRERLRQIKHIILVISGKGGTGKSTVSATLARALATDQSKQVGLLDLDICGPSAPRMFSLEGEQVYKSKSGWTPIYASDNLAVMSCGFLLESLDEAIIWRGPKKNTMIKQFLIDVDWGKLDYLIIDTPPGTSDEHISVVKYLKQTDLPNLDGAVMVTTPQEVSLMDVRKQIDFCKRTGLKVLGLVENMGRFVCPKCDKDSIIFPSTSGGANKLAADHGLDILGRLPLNPQIGQHCDDGKSLFDELESIEESGCSGDSASAQLSIQTQLRLVVQTFLDIKDKLIEKLASN